MPIIKSYGIGFVYTLYCPVISYKIFVKYCWMKNTRVSSMVCFTILVLPVLLDEEYWSFQYRVFYNTSIRIRIRIRKLYFDSAHNKTVQHKL